MKKKLFVEKMYNVGILESYKPSKNPDSPILGSFKIKGMTVENSENQNGRVYVPEVWQQHGTFKKGGKFFTEDGKLKPATLFGSADHPLDERVEYVLKEGAIAWKDIARNSDGTWDGEAHILNLPEGRIVKTYLDYAKEFGGGEMLGVSSRAIGDSVLKESNGKQLEYIVPEGFELMSWDFVYNPSFVTASAVLTEGKKTRRTLLESVKKLAEEDVEHSAAYKPYIKKIEEELKAVDYKKKFNEYIELSQDEITALSEEELIILSDKLNTVLEELYEYNDKLIVDEEGNTTETLEQVLDDLNSKAAFINSLAVEYTESRQLKESLANTKLKVESKKKSKKFNPYWAKLVSLIDGFDNKTNFLTGVDALLDEVKKEGTDTHLELHDKNTIIKTLQQYQQGITIAPRVESDSLLEQNEKVTEGPNGGAEMKLDENNKPIVEDTEAAKISKQQVVSVLKSAGLRPSDYSIDSDNFIVLHTTIKQHEAVLMLEKAFGESSVEFTRDDGVVEIKGFVKDSITENTGEKIDNLQKEEEEPKEEEPKGEEEPKEEEPKEEEPDDEGEADEEPAIEEEEPKEATLQGLYDEIAELKSMVELLTDIIAPIVEFEDEYELTEEIPSEEDEPAEEEPKEELTDEDYEDLDLSDEDLENMTEEELAYIEELIRAGQ